MLNEREKETLREIQRGFMDEDPAFTDQFRSVVRAAPGGRVFLAVVMNLVVSVLIFLSAVLVVVGSTGLALLFVALAAAIVAWRHRGRLRNWVESWTP